MSKTLLEIDGLDLPVESNQRFTTILRYLEQAKSRGERVTFRTDAGRVAVETHRVMAIREVLAPGETIDEAEASEAVGDEATGPFAQKGE